MSIWNQLYQAYKNKNCEQFKSLWANLTDEDKNSPYFSKYQSLYSKLCPEKTKKGKILFKGKAIKCPHCGASISKSSFNLESIKKLKQREKNVKFVCNYCGTEFSWSKTPFKSIFSDYTIGKEIELKGKKYKLAGAIKYKGAYNKNGYYGCLEYIEWLAYDEKGEIFYISESQAKDNEGTYNDLEISRKVNFPFVISNYNMDYVKTDKGSFLINEIDTVTVTAVYGEVNKRYKIGERIKIYNFSKYSLEIETTENGIERNLYKTYYSGNILKKFLKFKSVNNKIKSLKGISIATQIFNTIHENVSTIIISIFFLFIVSIMFKTYLTTNTLETSKVSKILSTNDIKNGNYEYKLKNTITSKPKLVRTYDYGGKKYEKYTLEGFYFKIKSNKDKELFLKFLKNQKLINSFKKTNQVNEILKSNEQNKKNIIPSKDDLILKHR